MATKTVSVRLTAAELDALAQYPGRTTAQKIRAAILRGSVADEIAGRVADAAADALRAALHEQTTDLIDAMRDSERALRDEIWQAVERVASPPAPRGAGHGQRPEQPEPEPESPTQAVIKSLRERGIIS